MESYNFKNVNTSLNNELEVILQSSFPEELNIYNQAYLLLDCPLMITSKVRNRTQFEDVIQFNIVGELQGQIICFIDTYNKSLTENEEQYINSLFSESMNILLGKMVTALENKNNVSCLISSPIKKDNYLFEIKQFKNKRFSTTYKLISNSQEFDCRIIVDVFRKNIIEV